jgi:hypothetical protein
MPIVHPSHVEDHCGDFKELPTTAALDGKGVGGFNGEKRALPITISNKKVSVYGTTTTMAIEMLVTKPSEFNKIARFIRANMKKLNLDLMINDALQRYDGYGPPGSNKPYRGLKIQFVCELTTISYELFRNIFYLYNINRDFCDSNQTIEDYRITHPNFKIKVNLSFFDGLAARTGGFIDNSITVSQQIDRYGAQKLS